MEAKLNSASFDDPEVSQFLDDAYKIIKEEALQAGTNRQTPVVEFKHPDELQSILELDITSEGASHETLLEAMKQIVKYSVKSGHPQYHNQLYGGLDPYSQVGAWLTTSLNANIHTFEVSPVFIVMEKYLFGKINKLIGFENGDGIFCPGGSALNIFGLHLARFNKFPEVKTKGLFGLPPLRCYTSVDAHYSLKKGANYLGFGTNNVVAVKVNAKGQILTSDLERCIQEDQQNGYQPLFVMATCGSTVLGSYDDLEALSVVCNKYSLWLHADACWGGGVLLSQKHRHLVAGSHLCNSFAWNFHKMCGAPVQCSAFLVNDTSGNLMQEANGVKAEYLFQPDKFYDTSYDIGDKSIQCGRNVDIVKLWLQWRARGDAGMETVVDRAFDNATYLMEKIKTTDGFRLVIPEFECVNICFWYIPPRLRGLEENEEWWQALHKVAPKIKERMVKCGTLMIGYQPLSTKGLVNFFRIIIHNPLCGPQDMDFVLNEIDRLGRDL